MSNRHQANGEVENKIKTVDRLMHSFISRGTSWRESIRQVKNIMNNQMVNDSTKFTPYEVAHGHKHISPFDRQIEIHLENTKNINAQAKANIEASKIQQQYYYNKGKSTRLFKQDDWVLVYDNHRKGYQSDMRRGPYKVEKALGDDNYLVHDHHLGKWNKYNVEKLKLYIPTLDFIEPPLDQLDLDTTLLPQPKFPFQKQQQPHQQQQPQQPQQPQQQQQQQQQVQQLQQPQLQQQEQQSPRRELVQSDTSPQDQQVAPPDQPRYSTRSRVALPGKSYDYQYRKNTYS
jgi:hypothetical protein